MQTTIASTGSIVGLRCRECGRTTPIAAVHVCDFCFGPLEVAYDYDAIRATTSRERIAAGPLSIWRYADLLPVLGDTRVDLGAGFTPLVQAPRLGEALGLNDLWVKNDTVNPTYSFKDRVVSVALSAARELGFSTVACASTGNLAHSVAAHAAAHGLRAYVFVPDDLEREKILGAAVYGATVIAVRGNYDDVNRLCGEVADAYGWAFVNVNVRPFYAEGSKTIGFEVAEQLGWQLPEQIVAPMASGSMLVKIDKAFTELVEVGLVDAKPWRMFGAQAQGCSPIATALLDGSGDVIPVKPATIAKSLAIGNPADGYYALDAVGRTGGWMGAIEDVAIGDAIELLARTEGIFAETAGGVTVGVARDLAAAGRLDPDARTVLVISGVGLKTLDAISGRVGPSHHIGAGLADLQAALGNQEIAR